MRVRAECHHRGDDLFDLLVSQLGVDLSSCKVSNVESICVLGFLQALGETRLSAGRETVTELGKHEKHHDVSIKHQ